MYRYCSVLIDESDEVDIDLDLDVIVALESGWHCSISMLRVPCYGRRDCAARRTSSMSSSSKIKNKSSFGRSEIDDHNAIDRIIVIVSTISLTALGVRSCRSMLHRGYS